MFWHLQPQISVQFERNYEQRCWTALSTIIIKKGREHLLDDESMPRHDEAANCPVSVKTGIIHRVMVTFDL